MAGDLKIYEQAVVLTAGARDFGAQSAVRSAVEQASGGVTHQYGQRVIIAAMPPAAQALQRQAPFAIFSDESSALPEETGSDLDQDEALGLEAFNLRLSHEYKEAKAQRPLENEPWDSGAANSDAGPSRPAGSALRKIPRGWGGGSRVGAGRG